MMFLVGTLPGRLSAQCDMRAVAAKYWQYRENLYRHFIVTDRDKEFGCIHDGIGQDSDNPCAFSKNGYSLPATSINMENNGGIGGGGDRFDDEREDAPIYDTDCLGNISNTGDNNNHTYNWTEYGVETLTQLGWYIVTLCTEYELLRINGQSQQQKRTLEDIFLALQAIRRLDMQTQCLLQEVYRERSKGELLCSEPYFEEEGRNTNFDSKIVSGCQYQADLSGYGGFFIREDATPALEAMLHDPSDESYHTDAIGSAFALSMNDNTEMCPSVDRFCYLMKNGRFYSQDQIINLLHGLAYVKRYIPASATVTTCEGETYNVLSIAQNITKGIVNHVDAPGTSNHIVVPGSEECCELPVKLTEREGGLMWATMHGIVLAYEYITGEDRNTSFWQLWGYGALSNVNVFVPSEANMYFTTGVIGRDVIRSDYAYINNFSNEHKEIYILSRALLHPDDPLGDEFTDAEYDQIFRKMLCNAPCGGPCRKSGDYDDYAATGHYPDFNCPNTPDWLGQRWEANDSPLPESQPLQISSRRFNGLDFMALFNMYLLRYESEMPYFSPDAASADEWPLRSNGLIEGPGILCLGSSGEYKIVPAYPSSLLNHIEWSSTENIKILTPVDEDEIKATLMENHSPSYIASSYNEQREIPQYYGGETSESVTDVCNFSSRKEVVSASPQYDIVTDLDFCGGLFTLTAMGPDVPHVTFKWTVYNAITGVTTEYSGGSVAVSTTANSNNLSMGTVTLTATGHYCIPAVTTTTTYQIPFSQCVNNAPSQLVVFPNPTHDNVTIAFTQDDFDMAVSGIQIRVIRNENAQIVKEARAYAKISELSVENIPNGSYIVQAILPESGGTLSAPLTILHQ